MLTAWRAAVRGVSDFRFFADLRGREVGGQPIAIAILMLRGIKWPAAPAFLRRESPFSARRWLPGPTGRTTTAGSECAASAPTSPAGGHRHWSPSGSTARPPRPAPPTAPPSSSRRETSRAGSACETPRRRRSPTYAVSSLTPLALHCFDCRSWEPKCKESCEPSVKARDRGRTRHALRATTRQLRHPRR